MEMHMTDQASPNHSQNNPSEKTRAEAAQLQMPPTGKGAPKGSLLGRFFRFVFGAESRFGRGVRLVLRTLAVIVGFFALGFLTAYLLFYVPVLKGSQSGQAELAQLRSDMASKQTQLDAASQSSQSAETERKRLDTSLTRAQSRIAVLQAANQIYLARYEMATQDSAAAGLAVDTARNQMKAVLPDLVTLGVEKPETLNTLFDLVKSDIGRDPKLASQDLDRLTSELQLIDKNLQ
jgi:hypothetical protein